MSSSGGPAGQIEYKELSPKRSFGRVCTGSETANSPPGPDSDRYSQSGSPGHGPVHSRRDAACTLELKGNSSDRRRL
jgi:hypothetical protein